MRLQNLLSVLVEQLFKNNEVNEVQLKSLNRNYEPYIVSSDEILEVWKYYKHQTGTLPEAATDLQELKTLILDLGARLPEQ